MSDIQAAPGLYNLSDLIVMVGAAADVGAAKSMVPQTAIPGADIRGMEDPLIRLEVNALTLIITGNSSTVTPYVTP